MDNNESCQLCEDCVYCEDCIYIGEGDYICNYEEPFLVIEEWDYLGIPCPKDQPKKRLDIRTVLAIVIFAAFLIIYLTAVTALQESSRVAYNIIKDINTNKMQPFDVQDSTW